MEEKRVFLGTSDEAWYTNILTESSWDMTKLQMDILFAILSHIRKEAKVKGDEEGDERRNYQLALENSKNITYIVDNADFNELKQYKSRNSAETRFAELNPTSRKYKHKEAKIRIKDQMQQEMEYRVFEQCLYENAELKVKLDAAFVDALIKDFKYSKFIAYIKAKYYFSLKKEASKKIYIMCRMFITAGRRFKDNEWQDFLQRIGVRKKYSYSMIRSEFLEKAKEDIDKFTDITIDYEIREKPAQGGKKPISITFIIDKKSISIDMEAEYEPEEAE